MISSDKFPQIKSLSYTRCREHIRAGDILLCSGNGLFPSLIKRATASIWSHVAFILPIPEIDRIMVLESVETRGVQAVPLSSYVNNYLGSGKPYNGRLLIARHDNFDPWKLLHVSRTAIDLLGYPYSYREIAKITMCLMLRWAGKGQPNALKKDKEFICSQFVELLFNSMKIEIPHDPRGFIVPDDFAKDQNINAVCSIINN